MRTKGMKLFSKAALGAAAGLLVLGAVGQAHAASILSLIQNGPNQASDEDREYLIDRVQTNIAGGVAAGTYTVAANNVRARQLEIAKLQGVADAGRISLTYGTGANAGKLVSATVSAGAPITILNYGQLDVGDSLRGSININTLNSAGANVGGGTTNNELTAVFQTFVTGKVSLGFGITAYTFGVDPAFAADLNGGIGAATGFVPGAGAMAVLFEDTVHNFAGDFNDTAPATPPLPPDDGAPFHTVPPSSADVSVGPYLTEEAFIALARDGTWFATLGFLGLPGEGAEGVAVGGFDNVLASFALSSGSAGATNNFGLNLLALGPAGGSLVVNRVTPNGLTVPGLVDFALSQQARGVNDLDTPFEVSSNTNISFNATVVPEPTTMLLLGTGLLGIGGLSRRRRGKKS